MQPIVNYEGYIPGRTPTPEMLCRATSTPQYILDKEREEALQREREELQREREDKRKQLEYDKIRNEIRRTEIERIRRTEIERIRRTEMEQIRRTEMEKLREELRQTELQKKKPRGRAPVGKQWNVKQGVWESDSDSESE